MEHRAEQQLDSGMCCGSNNSIFAYVHLLSMWIQSSICGLLPLQVDFQRPVVISQVATQGAKQLFQHQYVLKYFISYSTDRRKWIYYKGDSRDLRKVGGSLISAMTYKSRERCAITSLFLSVCVSPSFNRYSLGTREPMTQRKTSSFLLWLDASSGSTPSNGTMRPQFA